MTSWQHIERVTVRRVGTSFIGEGRTHAHFAVGEMSDTPEAAMESAAKALLKVLAPMIERARKTAPPKPDDFEDLL